MGRSWIGTEREAAAGRTQAKAANRLGRTPLSCPKRLAATCHDLERSLAAHSAARPAKTPVGLGVSGPREEGLPLSDHYHLWGAGWPATTPRSVLPQRKVSLIIVTMRLSQKESQRDHWKEEKDS